MFYAGINLGFGSGYESQVNEAMLQSACYDLISYLHSFQLPNQPDPILPTAVINNKQKDDIILIDEYASPDSPLVATDDSILTVNDSTLLVDSTKIKETLTKKVKVNEDSLRLVRMSQDSTARLQYFRYQREDYPYTTLTQKRNQSFLLNHRQHIKRVRLQLIQPGSLLRSLN